MAAVYGLRDKQAKQAGGGIFARDEGEIVYHTGGAAQRDHIPMDSLIGSLLHSVGPNPTTTGKSFEVRFNRFLGGILNYRFGPCTNTMHHTPLGACTMHHFQFCTHLFLEQAPKK